jgi:hypothetical protein
MQSNRIAWLAPLLRGGLSWAAILFGIAFGGLTTTMLAGLTVDWSGWTEWSRVFGFSLLGLVSLLASILALRNRRQAALLYLFTAPIMSVCLAWWQRLDRYENKFLLHRFLAVFAGTAVLFILPGLFWLITGRRGWGPLIGGVKPQQPVGLNAALFVLLVFFCAFASCYVPLFELDCGGRPPVSVQSSPLQTVFTGKVILIGRHPRFSHLSISPWALMRVEHVYWGLPRWMSAFVLVRGYFPDGDAGQEYFVDAQRSQGVLTRFLPVVDHYPCCHTAPISDAEVDLRVLRDGPPKSSVRIIGRVYSFLTSRPGMKYDADVSVTVTGSAGSIRTTTDDHGIYDFRDLPPGQCYPYRVLRTWGSGS